ncbi:hypothetical protein F610DRAFT_04510 [Streptomyces sp. LaPpAH-199]|nr:hypothetical protein F610DRAFT_04510 [Streptomyces sp. LaPpAH-199]
MGAEGEARAAQGAGEADGARVCGAGGWGGSPAESAAPAGSATLPGSVSPLGFVVPLSPAG